MALNEQEKHDLLYAGVGLGIAIAAGLLLKGGGTPTPAGVAPPASKQQLDFAIQSATLADNYTQHQSDAALATITSLTQGRQATDLGMATIEANTKTALANAVTQEDIARIQADAQVKTSQFQKDTAIGISGAQVQISANQSDAIKAASSNQLAGVQAQAHAQQQSSLYGAIGGWLSTIGAFFGL